MSLSEVVERHRLANIYFFSNIKNNVIIEVNIKQSGGTNSNKMYLYRFNFENNLQKLIVL